MQINNTVPKGAKPKGKPRGGSRKGIVNKVTREFRETVTTLLSDNAPNVGIWLAQVADGHGDNKPDPGRALDLLAKLAEYAAPKLNRVEVSGADGGPVLQDLTVRFVGND